MSGSNNPFSPSFSIGGSSHLPPASGFSLMGDRPAPSWSLLNPQTEQTAFKLTEIPSFTSSTPLLSQASLAAVSAPTSFMDKISYTAADRASSDRDLINNTLIESIGSSTLHAGAFVLDTAMAGKELAHGIDKKLEAGKSPLEAYVCATAKTLVGEGVKTLATGTIIAGIPVLAAEALAMPPVGAAALTFGAAKILPEAFAGAGLAGKAAGELADSACGSGFDFARQLTKGGNP